MKKIVLFFISLYCSCTLAYSQGSSDSLLTRNNWKLTSIDSCNLDEKFPTVTQYHLSFINFTNKALKKNKNDRRMKKKGYYTGVFYVKSDEKDFRSKYWSSVKGYYKIDTNGLLLNWNDNFKVQKNWGEINEKLSFWFLIATNASGKIMLDGNKIILDMKQTSYKKEPICIRINGIKE